MFKDLKLQFIKIRARLEIFWFWNNAINVIQQLILQKITIMNLQ